MKHSPVRATRPLGLALCAATCVSLVAAEAAAGGFLVARFGGEHGHPTTDNPTAIYYNPAGLSLGTGTRLYLDGNFAWRTFTYDRDPDAIDNPQPAGEASANTPRGTAGKDGVAANSGEAKLANFIASPFAAVVTDFGVKGLGVGASFSVPFGGTSVWDDGQASEEYPGSVDGTQRWWVIEGTIQSIYLTGAAAYEIPDTRLSIGLAVNTVLSKVHTVRARNTDGTDNLVVGDQLQEGRALVEVSGVDLSIGFGLLWQPLDNLWIGASYQSQPGFGEQKLEGDGTIIVGKSEIDGKKTKMEFFQELPDVVRLGARYRPTPVSEIRLFGDYQRWSVFTEQCFLNADIQGRSCTPGADGVVDGKIAIIPRDWEDTFGVRAGYSHWLGSTEVLGGLGYDSNAVPDDTIDPSLYDTDKVTASLGARFVLIENALHLGATFTQVVYFERTVDARPKKTLADGTNTISDISGTSIKEHRRGPDAAGTYSTAVSLLNLNVEYAF